MLAVDAALAAVLPGCVRGCSGARRSLVYWLLAVWTLPACSLVGVCPLAGWVRLALAAVLIAVLAAEAPSGWRS
ncbi:hypothetical protein [Pyrodictium abyssi]|uniref:Uncharacterized protein n=1 Tax=Pyrodictium abyssi TaxID=54256 RepID=A0ABN6ZNI4_9CREN|nr:hypothetical protein PABY_13410 [Pyrodictium abyssi]